MRRWGWLVVGLLFSGTSIAAICDANPNGSYCAFKPELEASKTDNVVIHCGDTPVWLTKRQYQVVGQYLSQNKLLVLKQRYNGELIDFPCHF